MENHQTNILNGPKELEKLKKQLAGNDINKSKRKKRKCPSAELC